MSGIENTELENNTGIASYESESITLISESKNQI